MSEDKILLDMLKCAGANKPHHAVDFSSVMCPQCGDFMNSANCDNNKPSFQDWFKCVNCYNEAKRFDLFKQTLDLENNYDVVRAILFTEDSEINPSAELTTRINNAVDALINRGLSEDKAEDIVLSEARCYTCGLDNTLDNLTLTFDYTSLKPFYVCKHDVWMIGGF